ncbi:hypothetical protein OB13_06180 [Pontibacter sp. HJ8]|jgi:hypothetical protein
MKNLFLLSLIIIALFGCEKDNEEERLMKTKLALSKDWQLHSVKITEPSQFRLNQTLDNCSKLKIWSFEDTGYFSFKEEEACNPHQYVHAGSWRIENGKFLKIVWKEINYGQPGGEMNLLIEEVSADSLKLKHEVILYDGDNKPFPGVQKYTFIRK